MHQKRIEKLQALLRADRIDSVFYADSGNMQYFLDDASYFWQRTTETGFGRTPEERAHNGHFAKMPSRVLVIPADGEPTLVALYAVAEQMAGCGVTVVGGHFATLGDALAPFIRGRQRIAVGQSCDAALRQYIGQVDSSIGTPDGERYGERLRAIKDEAEIEKLRAVAAFTDRAMGRIAKALVPGATPLEIKALIGQIALEGGCADLAFDPGVICVQQGMADADILFSHSERHPMAEGTAIGFDYGFVLDGYCSDYGRSFHIGSSPEIRDAYKALQEAQLSLFEKIRPGVGMDICFDTLYSALEPSGWAPYLRRSSHDLMGHQIGIDVHEQPWLRGDEDEATFQPGMVLCIEPKIWWPGKCYLRCEDMVLITENGCEALTTYSRSHFEL